MRFHIDRQVSRLLEDVAQDLRYATRQIRRAPGFSATVILCLALGLGATTTVYTSVFITEVLSMMCIVAFVSVGPTAAVLGGLLRSRRFTAAVVGAALLVLSGAVHAQEVTPVNDPSKTIYGEKNPRAPRELDTFGFLIGTWDGTSRTKLPDGKVVDIPLKWIGRYILDGMAIADEGHGPNPDGSTHIGITFRQYDTTQGTWIIEYLNVSHSFLRRQVRPGTGSVVVNGRNVTIHGEALGVKIREHYLVRDDDNWVYSMDMSRDDGKTWDIAMYEFTFRRAKP